VTIKTSKPLKNYGTATVRANYIAAPSTRQRAFTCIDLFAGCGGLSLGLEQAGFKPLLFSELNLSAAETYLANRVNEDIIPIGDVYQLTDSNLELLKIFWRQRGVHEVDLVCGGPPCQGYSGIGHRRTFKLDKKDIPSNHLYQEMIRVIRVVKPRIFLFENVRGLLTARWSPEGEKGELFRDVLAEFKAIPGYTVRWQLVHAKDYGVPQNRPRILMVGVRNDVVGATTQLALMEGHPDIDEPSAVEHGFLPQPSGDPPTLVDLLSDLVDVNYLRDGRTSTYPSDPKTPVQAALRTTRDGCVLGKNASVTDQEYSDHAPYIREKFAHMIANDGEIPEQFRTKKFAQRVFPREWGPTGPNLTATSLPEDYVHYSQPRGPTVREWARLQTFPDWYEFCGPRTTGGRRRAGDPDAGIWDRDVPRYTQIGNAVPVQLARKVGEHLISILNGTAHLRL
jgi:DNA (cytosine-5)-methyltransferase 1